MGAPRTGLAGLADAMTVALVDPRALTERAIEHVRHRADAKNLGIHLDCECPRVWLRAAAFSEALCDLLERAVTVSRQGCRVTVKIRGAADGGVVWQIQDVSNGAPSGAVDVLRARNIIEGQGADLCLESAPGVGTTATIMLPGRR